MNFKKTALHGSSPHGWEVPLRLGHASQLAHVALEGAEATVLAWGLTGVRVLDAETTQGLVAWDSKCVVVAFRGTQGYPDWVANLNMLPKRQRYGKLHREFYRAVDVQPSNGEVRGTKGRRVWGSVIPIEVHKLDRYVRCIARLSSVVTPFPF
jgi:hypothetical protein